MAASTRFSVALMVWLLTATAGHATDLDFAGDTIPYLVVHSECVLATSPDPNIDTDETHFFNVVSIDTDVWLQGQCTKERLKIAIPKSTRIGLLADAILFLSYRISEEEARHYDCGDVCINAFRIASEEYGVVGRTPLRVATIQEYARSSLAPETRFDWSVALENDGVADAFIQNSALWALSVSDPELQDLETQDIFKNLLSDRFVNDEVAQFGISLLAEARSPSVDKVLQEIMINPDATPATKIGVYDTLDQKSNMNDDRLKLMDSLRDEINLLRNEYFDRDTTVPGPTGLEDAQSMDSSRFELRRAIEDPGNSLTYRLQAISEYDERLKAVSKEAELHLAVPTDSRSVERGVRELNANIRQRIQEGTTSE